MTDIKHNKNIVDDEKYNQLYLTDDTKSNKTIVQFSMMINSNKKKSDNIIIGIDPYVEVSIYFNWLFLFIPVLFVCSISNPPSLFS